MTAHKTDIDPTTSNNKKIAKIEVKTTANTPGSVPPGHASFICMLVFDYTTGTGEISWCCRSIAKEMALDTNSKFENAEINFIEVKVLTCFLARSICSEEVAITICS